MSAVDTRNVSRDSLFLFAELVVDGQADGAKVKVRNLSAGGMMAEGALATARGDRVTVTLRNVGNVRGVVAWVQGNRFGVAFDTEVDPLLARPAVKTGESASPRYTRPIGAGGSGQGMRAI